MGVTTHLPFGEHMHAIIQSHGVTGEHNALIERWRTSAEYVAEHNHDFHNQLVGAQLTNSTRTGQTVVACFEPLTGINTTANTTTSCRYD